MLTSLLLAIIVALAPGSPRPTIAYTLRFDAAHLDVAELAIELRHAPTSVSLAMRVHAEYDARYWRFVDGFQIEHTANDGAASVVREDSTLWRVTLPGGRRGPLPCAHSGAAVGRASRLAAVRAPRRRVHQ